MPDFSPWLHGQGDGAPDSDYEPLREDSLSRGEASTRVMLRQSLLVCGGAFLLCFSMVPLYRIACERVFGIKLDNTATSAVDAAAQTPDLTRSIKVQFVANVNSGLAWEFAPDVVEMTVHPGVPTLATFTASNRSSIAIVGNAVPSVAPAETSKYFNKTECFCFTEQRLEPGESRAMPVQFIVDRALPPEVRTLTLSYTFYRNDIATERVAMSARSQRLLSRHDRERPAAGDAG